MIYFLFRFLGFVCPLIPARLGYWLFARFGDTVYAFNAKPDSIYIRNLRRVLGDSGSPAQVRAVARRGYQNLLKNYFDLFRAHGVDQAKLKKQLAGVQGLEHLENAMKQGKGVIAGTGHFGAWDMVIHLTGIFLNTRVLVPQEHLKPEKMFQYISSLRREQGIDVVAVENSPREILRAIRAGRIVGLAFDRDITESGQVVQFFGAPARLPDGAVQLALKYGSPVVVGFAVREQDNRARVMIEPPLTLERSGDLSRDLCRGVEKIASIMEKYIHEFPDQWLMFQKVWLEN